MSSQKTFRAVLKFENVMRSMSPIMALGTPYTLATSSRLQCRLSMYSISLGLNPRFVAFIPALSSDGRRTFAGPLN